MHIYKSIFQSTVTTFAKFFGISGLIPLYIASLYANNWSGIVHNISQYVSFRGTRITFSYCDVTVLSVIHIMFAFLDLISLYAFSFLL